MNYQAIPNKYGAFVVAGSNKKNSGNVDLSAYWKSDGSSVATDNWDLGNYGITADSFSTNLTGTPGQDGLSLKNYDKIFFSDDGNNTLGRLYLTTAGKYTFNNSSLNYGGTLDFSSILTEGRNFVFPDASGTIALTSDLYWQKSSNIISPLTTGDVLSVRKIPRVFSTDTLIELTPEIDTYDVFNITAQDQNLTVLNASTSTPAEGEIIEFNIASNGSPYTITWDTQYNGFPTDIPAIGKLKLLGEWDNVNGVWNYLSTPNYWTRDSFSGIVSPAVATDSLSLFNDGNIFDNGTPYGWNIRESLSGRGNLLGTLSNYLQGGKENLYRGNLILNQWLEGGGLTELVHLNKVTDHEYNFFRFGIETDGTIIASNFSSGAYVSGYNSGDQDLSAYLTGSNTGSNAHILAMWTNGAGTKDLMSAYNLTYDTGSGILQNYSSVGTSHGYQVQNSTTNAIFGLDSTNGYIGTISNHGLNIKTNNTTRLTVSNAGNVSLTENLDLLSGKKISIPSAGGAIAEYAGHYIKIGQAVGTYYSYITSDSSIGMSLRWNSTTGAGVAFASTDFIPTSNLGFNLGYSSIWWNKLYTKNIRDNATNVGMLDATSPFDVGTGRGLHIKSDQLATLLLQGYYKDGTTTSYNSQTVFYYSTTSLSRILYTPGNALFAITNEYVGSDATHVYGDITFGVKTGGGSTLYYPWSIKAYTGNLYGADGYNIQFGTTTGSKIGTATTEKFAFYGSTPIAQPSGDLISALSNLGLVATPKILYGSFYVDDGTTTVTCTATNTYYEIGAGMSDGGTDGFTFQNAKELKVLTAGTYKVDWGISFMSNTSDNTIACAVMINSTVKHNTEGATRAKENGVVYSASGTGILTLAVNDVVKLCVRDYTTAGAILTIDHANLSIIRVK